MNNQWLNIIGLLLNLIGTGIFAYGLIINKKTAIELGVSRYSGNTDESKLKLPQVKDRRKQSRNATIGIIIIIIGSIIQIYVNWPKI